MADETPTIPDDPFAILDRPPGVTDEIIDAFEAGCRQFAAKYGLKPGERVPERINAGLAAVVPLAEARAAERIAAAIEAHAESIGWYEGGGAWSDSIEIAREAGAAEPDQPDTPHPPELDDETASGLDAWEAELVAADRPDTPPISFDGPTTIAAPVVVHEDFYEDDEPVADVIAAFEAGEKVITRRPTDTPKEPTP